jgi:hypothetical protein
MSDLLEVRPECAALHQDLVSRHGGELGRDPKEVLFLHPKDAEMLLYRAGPIHMRVNGSDWVLNHTEALGWFLEPRL